MKLQTLILASLFLALTPACATTIVRGNPQFEAEMRRDYLQIYPATTFDVLLISTPFLPLIQDVRGSEASNCFGIGPYLLLFGCLDLPFSLISDTLMLPHDLLSNVPPAKPEPQGQP
ncbi:MAG: hypothetical protein RL095_57 [Verrucomicrobiota bacterium]|jgi:hypothetical protein